GGGGSFDQPRGLERERVGRSGGRGSRDRDRRGRDRRGRSGAIGGRWVLVPDVRRQQDDQLALGPIPRLVAEERPERGDPVDAGQSLLAVILGVLDQAADDDGGAVGHHHIRGHFRGI